MSLDMRNCSKCRAPMVFRIDGDEEKVTFSWKCLSCGNKEVKTTIKKKAPDASAEANAGESPANEPLSNEMETNEPSPPAVVLDASPAAVNNPSPEEAPVKRRRGRPRKNEA